MKSYQFFTEDGRGGTMLCDDETLEVAVAELTRRFKGVVRVQIGEEIWTREGGFGRLERPASPPESGQDTA